MLLGDELYFAGSDPDTDSEVGVAVGHLAHR